MLPVNIPLQDFETLVRQIGSLVIRIWHSFEFTINGHTYSGFVVLIACLIFYYLVEFMWGGDEDE